MTVGKRFFVKETLNLDLKGRTMCRTKKEEKKTDRGSANAGTETRCIGFIQSGRS